MNREPIYLTGQLVLQDVLTLHGAQLRTADLIVCSPPCQEFSYRAMPWKRAKALPPPYLGMRLFWSCFRIQQEACEAAGRYIPMVVENVCGAQRWIGDARWHFGSYYLWGDIPALMPPALKALKWGDCNGKVFPERAKGNVAAHREGSKVPGFRFDGSGRSFQTASVNGTKNDGLNWSNYGKPDYKAEAFNTTAEKRTRQQGGWFKDYSDTDGKAPRSISWTGSKSPARKAASAEIARIPFPLAQHIARCFKPEVVSAWPDQPTPAPAAAIRLALRRITTPARRWTGTPMSIHTLSRIACC